MTRYTATEITTYGGEDDGKVEWGVMDNLTDEVRGGLSSRAQAEAMAVVGNFINALLGAPCVK